MNITVLVFIVFFQAQLNCLSQPGLFQVKVASPDLNVL